MTQKILPESTPTRNAARLLRELADVFEGLTLSTPTPLRVPHTAWGMSRRRACELARAGAIAAVRIGRTYYATPAELEKFFAGAAEQPADVDPIEAARALGRKAASRG